MLAQKIAGLREKERLVLSLYYEKELNMKEIAQVLGVSAARVSQIHSRALGHLRTEMRPIWTREAERKRSSVMTKGFYNLTSGILSQTRRLDVIGNNMTNLSTPGYKAETYTDRTFEEVLISRVGNKDKSGAAVIGTESYILAPDQLYVNQTQGCHAGDRNASGFCHPGGWLFCDPDGERSGIHPGRRLFPG